MIIGVTGTIASGKNIVSDFLQTKGFEHVSLSQIIRGIAAKHGIGIERNALQDLGNQLREQNGAGALAKEALEIKKEKGWEKVVIDGIRNPGEVEVLRQEKDFYLIAVDAPDEMRFQRVLMRVKDNDPKSWEDFTKINSRDKGIGEGQLGQGVMRCMALANFKLVNDSTIETFNVEVEELYKKIEGIATRQTWDSYFMDIMEAVSKRSTCDRGRGASVIVHDKDLLTTGYIGSASGLAHCDEVGHLVKTLVHEDGTKTQHCLRSTHSEMNAICQAAKLGISINGATIYTKYTPCETCAKALINAGIKRVVCKRKHHYWSKEVVPLFEKAGVKVEFMSEDVEEYDGQQIL